MEVMVAVTLLGAVFVATAYIQSATARQANSLYGDSKTLHRAHLAMERIRFELLEATVDTLIVKDNGRTIEYYNPTKGGLTGTWSAYRFERDGPAGKGGHAVYYKDRSQSVPTHKIGLVSDVRFERWGPGRAVRVTITTIERHSWKLDRPYTIVAEITVRN